MKRSLAAVLSMIAVAGVAFAAAPAAAEALEAELVLEIYHSHDLPPTVAPPIKQVLLQVVAELEQGQEADAAAIWKKLWLSYPKTFSPVERARMLRWVLFRAFLTKGKPLREVIVAWEGAHATPSAQKLAIPDLQASIDAPAGGTQKTSNIMKNAHDTLKAIIQNMR